MGDKSKPVKIKEPSKIFICSWSDFFHPDADSWRNEAWAIIRQNNQHIYQILTKRPERIKQCLPVDWGNGYPHVWLGVTAETQEMADERIPILLKTKAAIRFVSIEPMLQEIDITKYLPCLDWVICGCESGSGVRPMHENWVFFLKEQCQTFKVPFFLKQKMMR
ncbi:MAG: DUF5131 family protein [Bacillota bacterium]